MLNDYRKNYDDNKLRMHEMTMLSFQESESFTGIMSCKDNFKQINY